MIFIEQLIQKEPGLIWLTQINYLPTYGVQHNADLVISGCVHLRKDFNPSWV